MTITILTPDAVASRALEALVAEEYRAGRLSKDELRDALGLTVLNEVDGFLKTRGIYEPYALEDLGRDVQTLERLGF